MTAPRPGDAVAVSEFGEWLSGVVKEVNDESGEFLVDFDDETEVPAWVSVGQAWRHIGPTEPAARPEEDTPVLPRAQDVQPAPTAAAQLVARPEEDTPMLPRAQDVQPAPTAAAPAVAPELAGTASGDDESQWSGLVLEQFAQLHQATVLVDGYGAEPANATLARFEQLHTSIEATTKSRVSTE